MSACVIDTAAWQTYADKNNQKTKINGMLVLEPPK
jgi:hypothetical protein